MYGHQSFGSFAFSSLTASAGTAFARLVEPWRGVAGATLLYSLINGQPNWGRAFTHITQLVYTAAGTAHDVVVMRPLNWARITADVAANSTTVVLETNPGAYSTAYKYPLGGGATKPAAVADNVIAASDYVAFQLRDGTWHLSTVASVSSLTLTLTTATPNVTGGGAAADTPLFFFGVAADSDPATGRAHLTLNSVASTRVNLVQDTALGTIPSLHAGDPMLVYSANATAAGTLNAVAGHYADR